MKQHESIGRIIACIHRHARMYFEKELAPFNLGSGALPVLRALLHHDGVTQQKLTERLHVDKATTTRTIGKLIKSGYVRREHDPEDKRAYRLFVTEKARETAPEIRRVQQSWTTILSEGFTEEEKKQAFALLNRMRDNALRNREKGER